MEFLLYNFNGELFDTVHGGSLELNRDRLNRAQGKLTIQFQIPILDLNGYWKPDLFRPRMQLDWKIRLESAGNRNFPYIALFNASHRNRWSFFSTNLVDDTVIELAMNQQECRYDVKIAIAVTPETEPFALRFDNRPVPWPQLLQSCRDRLGLSASVVPAGAWEPVYCTWYARHAALTVEFLDEAAEQAADLGFGTFIVDDGWSYDRAARVTPESAPTWYEEIGPWRVSAAKLPGFAEHVRRTRRLGLRYLLWTAPFFLGAKSLQNREVPIVGGEPGSFGVFDPACREEMAQMLREHRELFRNYSLDGVKLDFLAHIPSNPDHPHGRTAWQAIRELTDAIRQENPQALIEFRQFYSTPATLGLATQFRANDTPFDCLENLHRVAQLRLMLGDGIAVHADPACWHPQESAENVARHMVAAIAGVPMVSMDLARLSDEHRGILRDSLNFYRKHQEFFRRAHWSVRYDGDQLASLTAEREGRRIVWLVSAAGLPDAEGACCVLNPSGITWRLNSGELLTPGRWLEQTAMTEGVSGNNAK